MLKVTFLGTAAVLPETDGDTVCHVVNETVVFDTGWNAALRLPRFGLDPLRITHLLFTHFHHDHYLGLPQFLFQRQLLAAKATDTPPLILGGPAEDLETVVGLARAFLQEARFPGVAGSVELLPLVPGDGFSIGDLSINVGRSGHPVPAHGYRVEDTTSGAILCVTGDTEYTDELVRFHQGADLLITEASFGPRAAPDNNPYGHMGAIDAARLAREAGVKRLALTHARQEQRVATLAAARTIFPETFWPADGEEIVLSA
ncbi:MAG: MBL fold metallo-hydrolase [Capsulimonadales bacterium]|nr:MBL fold metallo-hydrolase [Capsulimonadales bacterium]